ncbi:nicotinate-nucleotide adenylyltransferase [Alkalibacillus aidingensis]|uniref:nicotinate-nucleotide adenylyltransferase n=1 Tax=Alkalibacillus aidingensis TaxID=2747607 RepID=UPI00166080F0|nr:nicotinate-nucleotide adenylyltransferase [Alkalibacillus aidingensis]
MSRIGLFGGTFDPPHIGHVSICQTVIKELKLDEVWLIPTYQPPHKEDAKASFQDRYEMLKLLFQDHSNIHISTIEQERKGVSYTLDTVRQLKEQFPDNDFYFIIGGDMVEYLPKWHRINELKELVQFVGVSREGYGFSDPDVLKVEMEEVLVSSTEIRQQLFQNKDPIGLPDDVLNYIKENHLYAR